jgi:hypothetical protein
MLTAEYSPIVFPPLPKIVFMVYPYARTTDNTASFLNSYHASWPFFALTRLCQVHLITTLEKSACM